METKKKEPLLRVVKHAELSRAQSIGLRLLAVVLAIAMGASAKDVGLQKHFYPAFKRVDRTLRKAAAQI